MPKKVLKGFSKKVYSSEAHISKISFAYNNTELIKLIMKRGTLIKEY